MTLYTLNQALDALTCCDNELHDGLDPAAKQNVTVLTGGRLRVTFTPYDEDGDAEPDHAESFTSGPFVRDGDEPPAAWAELIEGLQILARHPSDTVSPFHCEHDVLRVMADPEAFTPEEIERLETLGFDLDSDGFYSFKYGSA